MNGNVIYCDVVLERWVEPNANAPDGYLSTLQVSWIVHASITEEEQNDYIDCQLESYPSWEVRDMRFS